MAKCTARPDFKREDTNFLNTYQVFGGGNGPKCYGLKKTLINFLKRSYVLLTVS